MIPTGANLLQNLLFGGGDNDPIKNYQVTQSSTENPSWLSPGKGLLDMYLMKMLTANADMFKGFGMPAGANVGVMDDWFADITKLLSEEWPDLLEGYRENADSSRRLLPEQTQTTIKKDQLRRRA